MKDELEQLYRLQQLDTQLRAVERDLGRLNDGSAERAQLEEAREELLQRKELETAHEAERRDKELELGSTEEKRKQSMDRAYGGTISNPKELESLEMEIESLGRAKDRLEEIILELLEKLDDDAEAIAKQERVVRELAERVESIERTYAEETARLSSESESLRERREELLPQISARTLEHYEKLLAKNAGLAIVPVVERVCQGCNVNVTLNKIQRLETTGDETFCDNCKRYLYLEE